jgi:hypothetical protein
MNVQFIHDANYANTLPPTFLQQARDLANWHEYYTFTSPQLSGIGNSMSLHTFAFHTLTRLFSRWQGRATRGDQLPLSHQQRFRPTEIRWRSNVLQAFLVSLQHDKRSASPS